MICVCERLILIDQDPTSCSVTPVSKSAYQTCIYRVITQESSLLAPVPIEAMYQHRSR